VAAGKFRMVGPPSQRSIDDFSEKVFERELELATLLRNTRDASS
jgi:hypothetical protein